MSEELSGNEYRQQRIENMNKLEKAGYPPFGKAFDRTDRLDKLHASFVEGTVVKGCGRIVAIRKMGKMALSYLATGSTSSSNSSTTSTSGNTGTGLKKCMPQKFSGRSRDSARRLMLIVEVLDVIVAEAET